MSRLGMEQEPRLQQKQLFRNLVGEQSELLRTTTGCEVGYRFRKQRFVVEPALAEFNAQIIQDLITKDVDEQIVWVMGASGSGKEGARSAIGIGIEGSGILKKACEKQGFSVKIVQLDFADCLKFAAPDDWQKQKLQIEDRGTFVMQMAMNWVINSERDLNEKLLLIVESVGLTFPPRGILAPNQERFVKEGVRLLNIGTTALESFTRAGDPRLRLLILHPDLATIESAILDRTLLEKAIKEGKEACRVSELPELVEALARNNYAIDSRQLIFEIARGYGSSDLVVASRQSIAGLIYILTHNPQLIGKTISEAIAIIEGDSSLWDESSAIYERMFIKSLGIPPERALRLVNPSFTSNDPVTRTYRKDLLKEHAFPFSEFRQAISSLL